MIVATPCPDTHHPARSCSLGWCHQQRKAPSTHTHAPARTHTHMHARAHTHTHVRTSTHTCTRTHKHVHAHTHAHTGTHTQTLVYYVPRQAARCSGLDLQQRWFRPRYLSSCPLQCCLQQNIPFRKLWVDQFSVLCLHRALLSWHSVFVSATKLLVGSPLLALGCGSGFTTTCTSLSDKAKSEALVFSCVANAQDHMRAIGVALSMIPATPFALP